MHDLSAWQFEMTNIARDIDLLESKGRLLMGVRANLEHHAESPLGRKFKRLPMSFENSFA